MQFTVTAEDLINGAAACDSTNAQVQTEILQMQTYIAGLMAVYTGWAAQQLQNLSQQWGTDAANLNNVLTTIATNLRANANNYVANDTTAGTNYANIVSALPPARF
jgi:WXG100 family type VII secretion target